MPRTVVPRTPLFALLVLQQLLAQANDAPDVCKAGDNCGPQGLPVPARPTGRPYPWAHSRGWPQHGKSPHSFGGWPCNLSAKLAWSWEPAGGRYSNTGIMGPLVDDAFNLYVGTEDGIHKFSPNGTLLWEYIVPAFHSFSASMRKVGTLVDGLLISSISDGRAIGLSMETGKMVWETLVTQDRHIFLDFGFIVSAEGVVVGDAGHKDPPARIHNTVWAVNATDGSWLWEFKPDVGVWNFLPYMVGDGSVIFQDWDGGVYRLRLATGELLWRADIRNGETWTDGGPAMGPNGVFYTVSGTAGQNQAGQGFPGFLKAYKVESGALLWAESLDQTPYTYPAVGRLQEGGPLAVVTGVGSLAGPPLTLVLILASVCGLVLGLPYSAIRLCFKKKRRSLGGCCRDALVIGFLVAACVATLIWMTRLRLEHPTSVQAFDAETGKQLWRYDMPTWKWYASAGDERGFLPRVFHRRTPICLPLASSFPTLDAQGVFYMGHMDGRLYAIQDANGDGRIDEPSEVCSFDTGGSFGSSGPVIVDGMLAVGTCDSLFVFRQ